MIYMKEWNSEQARQLREYCLLRATEKDDKELLWKALADCCEFTRMMLDRRVFELWEESNHGSTEII